MFTGIIHDIGEIAAIDKQGDWTITIAANKLPLDTITLGASVACNGICLTVIGKDKTKFKVQVSAETLSKTTALHWRPGAKINLEPALRVGDELGGHLVLGHIDGVARLVDKRKDSQSLRYVFEVPHEFAKFVASKGSVAIDGVALTVNDVAGTRFGVNLIPYTQEQTILGALQPGDEANFESDLIARYTERMLNERAAS